MRKSFPLALALISACSFDLSRSPGSDRLGVDAGADVGGDLRRSDGPRPERPPVDSRTADGPQPPKPSGTICSADGWCWENPLPQGGTLHAVAVREDSSEVWAVGEGGVVLRSLNGGLNWEGWGAAGGVSQTLRGVWPAKAPSSDVVAVGDEGTILRYDGISWTKVSSGVSKGLNGIWGGASGLFAVGDGGTILTSDDGSVWKPETVGTTADLLGVSGLGDSVYAVGGTDSVTKAAVVLRRELQGSWATMITTLSQGTLYAVWLASGSNGAVVYAAGRSDVNYGEIIKSSDGGKSWSAAGPQVKPNAFRGIWGTSSGALFAAGSDGRIYDNHTGTWSAKELTVNDTNALKAVTGFASASSLAGTVITVGAGGVIARFDGKNAWAPVSQEATRADLYGVWGLADGTAVYAVGERSSDGEAVQRVGTKWELLSTFGAGLRDVWGTSTGASAGHDVYVVGKAGTIGHYVVGSKTWPPETSSEAKDLAAVSGTPDGKEVYAVGADGTALSRSATGSWSRLGGNLVPGVPSLTGVWVAGSKDVFATNGTQILYHWVDAWGTNTVFVQAMRGLWGTPGQLFAVGDGIALYESGKWKQEPNPVGPLERVWGDGAIVVAVGEKGAALSGIALRQATGGWTAMSAGTSATLRGVWGTKLASGKSLFYAVGPAGAILRREQ